MEFYLHKQWSNPAIRETMKWVYLDKYACMCLLNDDVTVHYLV